MSYFSCTKAAQKESTMKTATIIWAGSWMARLCSVIAPEGNRFWGFWILVKPSPSHEIFCIILEDR